MFDSIGYSELLVLGIVALVVIGPKDLPRAMRFVGKWVGKGRAMSRQFRSGFDAMMRETELEDLEKQWRAHNQAIMNTYPDVVSSIAKDGKPAASAAATAVAAGTTGEAAADIAADAVTEATAEASAATTAVVAPVGESAQLPFDMPERPAPPAQA